MSTESQDGVEITTLRVTREQADAIQSYVRRHDEIGSAREALDELGVAELDWESGQLPVEQRFDRIENAVEEMHERISALEQQGRKE